MVAGVVGTRESSVGLEGMTDPAEPDVHEALAALVDDLPYPLHAWELEAERGDVLVPAESFRLVRAREFLFRIPGEKILRSRDDAAREARHALADFLLNS